jgi:hypothetical protein
MKVSRAGGVLSVRADSYTLTFAHDRPFVYVDAAAGSRVAELFAFSSVHPLHDHDDTTKIGAWAVAEMADELVVSVRTESSVWRGKTYRYSCRLRRFTYEIEVEGTGRLAEAEYFGGYCSAWPHWGSGFFWSGQRFTQGFTPSRMPRSSTTFRLTAVWPSTSPACRCRVAAIGFSPRRRSASHFSFPPAD